MMRSGCLLLLLLLLVQKPVSACSCLGSRSVCGEVTTSDAVFIGTAESFEPRFFDPWDRSLERRMSERFSEQELERLEKDQSPEAVAKLKEAYLEIFPELPEPYKSQFARASSYAELGALFDSLAENGRRGPRAESIDVWSSFSSCGYHFEAGETYLVYADQNKGRFETFGCSRTTRLSNAGADLAYLFFFQRGGSESARLDGFVTSNELDLRTPRLWARVNHPVPNLVVELKSEHGLRYTRTDREGEFIFDGLASGDYSISVFDRRYPEHVQVLHGPKKVHIDTKGCATEVLLVRLPDQPKR
jgi:hypothetical protein